MKKHFVLLILCILLTSCLEAEVDFDLKRDGSGEMRMKIVPLERSLNPIINEIESDLRQNKNYRDSDITKKTESDGRVCLLTRKKFNKVEEADENCKFVSHKDYDEFKMDIPNDFIGIVKRVKVNMPGSIFESNVKNFQGRSLTWDRTLPSANRLVIKSKPPALIGNAILIAVILLLGIGVVAAIFIFKRVRKPKIIAQEINFCPECGEKAHSDDKFCQHCGKNLG